MRGTVKFFDESKGWGFLTSDEGTDYFVHSSAIQDEGYRYLDADDIVSFDIKECERGWYAVNVQPVLTRRMVEKALKKENLILKSFRNSLGLDRYLVVDVNNVIQTTDQGITLTETAAFAGLDVEGLLIDKKEDSKMSKDFMKNYVETVKTASQESEESILSKYNETCDNFKNLMPNEKKVLETCNISIDDSTDFPTVLDAIKNQWGTYDPKTKQAICIAISGEKSASNVMTYLDA